MERWQILTAPYRSAIDAIVMAFNGQMNAFRQLPIVNYFNKVVDRVSQQAIVLSEYVQLEVQLRDILRQMLRHTDQLTVKLMNEVKVIETFVLRFVLKVLQLSLIYNVFVSRQVWVFLYDR